MLTAMVSIPLTGLLGWYLSSITEVSGLALGLSAGTFFQLFLLNFRFHRQPELNHIWWPGRSVLNALVCSVPVGCSAWFLSNLGIWGRGPDVFSLFVEQPNACLHATIAPHALAGLGQVSVRLLLVEAGLRQIDSGSSSSSSSDVKAGAWA